MMYDHKYINAVAKCHQWKGRLKSIAVCPHPPYSAGLHCLFPKVKTTIKDKLIQDIRTVMAVQLKKCGLAYYWWECKTVLPLWKTM